METTNNIHNIYSEIETLFNNGVRKLYLIDKEGKKHLKRIGRTANGELLVMRTRTRGGYLSSEYWIKDFQVKVDTPESLKWKKSLNKALQMLEKSDLWEDIRIDIKKALNIGYDNLRLAYKTSNETFDEDYYKNEFIRTQKLKEIHKDLISINEDRIEHINTTILWQFSSPLKIKKMYFGKYNNENKLQQIKNAINNKEKFHVSGQAGYDVSFEYNPETKSAWYSEEFRGCGNGHYYLALNETHAFHYEDD